MSKKNKEDVSKPNSTELISLAEAAKISNLSPDHLRTLVRTGYVWGVKIGRNWVTTEAAVMEYASIERKPGRKPKSDTAQEG